jgi:hypothetical protein
LAAHLSVRNGRSPEQSIESPNALKVTPTERL